MGHKILPSHNFCPNYLSGIQNWHAHMPFAYDLLEVHKPKTIVELGVHYGDSYFCLCQSVKELHLGSLCYAVDTWQGDKQAGIYNDSIYEEVKSYNSRFYSDFSYLLRMPFADAREQFSSDQIDLLHIDGLHTYDAVSEDFNTWIDRVSQGGIVLLHDVTCREKGFGVWQFWEEIKNTFPSFLFDHGHGLGVIKKDSANACIQIGQFNLLSDSNAEIKKHYAHAYKIMRGMLLLENHEEKVLKLESKERNVLQKEQIASKQLSDILLRSDLLEKQIAENFKVIVTLQKNNNDLEKEVDKLKLIEKNRNLTKKQVEQSTKLGDSITWINPKQMFKVVFGTVFIRLSITLDNEENYESFFIKLGKRYIPCEAEFFYDKNDGNLFQIDLVTSFTVGNGFKFCRVFGESKSGHCQPLGWRMLYSISPSLNEKILPVSRENLNHRNLLSTCEKNSDYAKWLKYNKFNSRKRDFWHKLRYLRKSDDENKYSIIMPVFNPPLEFLREAVYSILDQTYTNWELCVVNDGSTNPEIHLFLNQLSSVNSQVIYLARESNGGITEATNDAISMSSGEFLVFVDHDDKIEQSALSEINSFLRANTAVDFLYTDDDKIDKDGNSYSPQFKPAWSPELMLSYCYVSHMKIVRSSISQRVGHFRNGYDGSQDYDYALRVCEIARKIGHIPKILYHWRASPSSTAASALNKPSSFEAGRKAVQDFCDRNKIEAFVSQPSWALREGLGIFALTFPDYGPSVEIMIPTRNNLSLLKRCLESLQLTTYQNFSITIIDNESDDPETVRFLETNQHHVLKIPHKSERFNFSYLVNQGVEKSSAKYVLLLNDDTEVMSSSWLSQMVGYLKIDGVGIVGAKLFFPDGSIQNAGIINGILDGLPTSVFRGFNGNESGYLNYLRVARNYQAITAACLLTTREIFQEIGGFDESKLAVAYNDVDFCYRVVDQLKKRCVFCSDAELLHKEGSSRGFVDDHSEVLYFKEKYAARKDPFYSPNFSSENGNFSIIPYCLPNPFSTPIKVLAISHNLNFEGAPLSMMEMITGLSKLGKIKVKIISLKEGPLRVSYEERGIPVQVLPFDSLSGSNSYYQEGLKQWSTRVGILDCDMLYANTMNCFFAIDAANNNMIPSVWNIRESNYSKESFGVVSNAVASRAFGCFQYPYRVVFVSKATQEMFIRYNKSNNFDLIRNVLAPKQEETSCLEFKSIPSETLILLNVGTICKRKAQEEIVTAFETLSEPVLRKVALVFLGDKSSSYAKSLEARVKANEKIKNKVIFIDSNKDTASWYKRASVFVFSSRNESYPRVILEAMNYKLPIITTSVFGIKEQVIPEFNAIVYDSGDYKTLKVAMEKLISNQDLRDSLSSKSQIVLGSLGSYNQMLKKYEETFLEAASSS